tara:strand:+ start:212 stop:409 length:198 start_codon:yes stop_codon:yes gene_type:complete
MRLNSKVFSIDSFLAIMNQSQKYFSVFVRDVFRSIAAKALKSLPTLPSPINNSELIYKVPINSQM